MQTQTYTTVNAVIDDLLDALGVDSFEGMDVGAEYQIENGVFMDLYVTKTAPNYLGISHYRKRNMDLIPDPSFGFRMDDDTDKTRFIPVELRQEVIGKIDAHRDKHGLGTDHELLRVFMSNIRNQGFIEAATPAAKVEEDA